MADNSKPVLVVNMGVPFPGIRVEPKGLVYTATEFTTDAFDKCCEALRGQARSAGCNAVLHVVASMVPLPNPGEKTMLLLWMYGTLAVLGPISS